MGWKKQKIHRCKKSECKQCNTIPQYTNRNNQTVLNVFPQHLNKQ